MKRKLLFATVSGAVLLSMTVTTIFAHAVVSPKEVGVGKFQTFSLGVPVEKNVATTSVRLVIPDGLNFVTPNVKLGWKIEAKTVPTSDEMSHDGDGDESHAQVTEISWTGGTIPAGQRDDFIFSAQVPASPTTLAWKVYQTYADGTVVAWDQDPNAPKASGQSSTPYSVTTIINDLANPNTAQGSVPGAQRNDMIAYVALGLSAAAIVMVLMNRSKKSETELKK